MKKILVLFGGDSHEHKISCKSAKTILENIDRKKYQVTSVGISKSNEWYIFDDDLELLKDAKWEEGNISQVTNITNFLKEFDKIFPIIHGNPEENGNLQGMLNMLNVKFVGPDLLGSIISYDKELTKIICDKYEIPQVEYFTVTENKSLKKIDIDFPVIVKPAKCGSSIGINIANNIKELNKHIKDAFNYDNKVVVEKYIKARELECAILDGKKLTVSPVGEIKPSNEFYDYDAKYVSDSNLLIPANITPTLEKQIQEYSKKIFNILSLKDLSRIDFLYDYENKKLYFNEVNTMPGFTDVSMYPLLFESMNISKKELITKLIEN